MGGEELCHSIDLSLEYVGEQRERGSLEDKPRQSCEKEVYGLL